MNCDLWEDLIPLIIAVVVLLIVYIQNKTIAYMYEHWKKDKS